MEQAKPVSDKETISRTWRVMAYIGAPMLSTATVPPQPGDQLNFTSRLKPKVITYRNLTIALLKAPPELATDLQLPPGLELAFLVADVADTTEALQAVESAVEVFEVIIDSLSFELGGVVRIGQFEVIDITAPVNVDDEREIRIFSGPPYGTNTRSVEMESVRGSVWSVCQMRCQTTMHGLPLHCAGLISQWARTSFMMLLSFYGSRWRFSLTFRRYQ
jgi:hypothetical protein